MSNYVIEVLDKTLQPYQGVTHGDCIYRQWYSDCLARKKAVEVVGLDLTKVAHNVVGEIASLALPSNPKIGRIINTKA